MCGFHHEFFSHATNGFLRDQPALRVTCQQKNCQQTWMLTEKLQGIPENSKLPECKFQPEFCPSNLIHLIPNARKNIIAPRNKSETQKADVMCGETSILYSKDSLFKINGQCKRRAELVCSMHIGVPSGRAWKHSGNQQVIQEGDFQCRKGTRVKINFFPFKTYFNGSFSHRVLKQC